MPSDPQERETKKELLVEAQKSVHMLHRGDGYLWIPAHDVSGLGTNIHFF